MNVKFEKTRAGRDLFYAFHGSRLENFHSIIHNGLHCHLNKVSAEMWQSHQACHDGDDLWFPVALLEYIWLNDMFTDNCYVELIANISYSII